MSDKAEKARIGDIVKLSKIFSKNNWDTYANGEAVFNDLSDILNNLNSEQRELMYELTDDFLWLTGAEYDVMFNNIFHTIANSIDLSNCRTIYLIPVLKVKDRRKIKSSVQCVYNNRSLLLLNEQYTGIQKKIVDSEYYEWISTYQFQQDGTEKIFFIDDFIGTGNTFSECWVDLTKNPTINITNSILISLVFQQTGFDFITKKIGIPIFLNQVRGKGISDKYKMPTLKENVRIMDDIESNIKPGPYRFGYEESEALVCMSRIPNNTFPVFWKQSTIRKKTYNPPFPRY
jgi:hypothetical protein